MDMTESQAIIQQQALTIEILHERLTTLESALPNMSGWEILSGSSGADFSQDKLQIFAELAKIYWLKNPFVKRAVEIQVLY